MLYLDTLPRTAGGRKQHNAGSVVRKASQTELARDKEKNANLIQWQWVQHWFTRRGILDSSYPVESSRHASGQWLYRSHSEEHRRIPSLCTQSIISQKFQRRGFQSGGQRLCEDQHTLKRRGIPMRTKKCVCRTILQTSYQSQDAWSGDIASLSSKEIAA